MSVLIMMGFDEFGLLPNDSIPGNLMTADGWGGTLGPLQRAPGRFGIGKCLQFNATTSAQSMFFPLRTRSTDGGGTLEFAFQSIGDSGSQRSLSIWDSVSNAFPIGFDFLSLARLSIKVNNTVRYTTIPGGFVTGQWHWIQVKWTAGVPGSDTAIFKLDGNLLASYTGLTIPNAMDCWRVDYNDNNTASKFGIRIDDLVIQNLLGPAPNNDLLGNVRVGAQWADGAGDLTDFTVVGAATNWEASKNIAINTGVYVETDTVGDTDLYNLIANVPAREIYGIQVKGTFLQTDATQLYGALVIKTGGTEFVGTQLGLASGYRSQWWNWDTNPDTTIAWTNSDLADLQIGPTLNASD